MGSAFEVYTKSLRDSTGYSATWLPTTTVAVGDVGSINDGQFRRLTTLKALGMPCKAKQSNAKGDIAHSTADSVRITAKAAGKSPLPGSALAAADAGVTIDFSSSKGVVFVAKRCIGSEIEDLLSLERSILDRHKAGKWELEHVVVTEVLAAEATTVLISAAAGAKIELRADGRIQASDLRLASIDARFSVAHESLMATNITASGGLTPLFRASAIRRRWLRPDTFRKTRTGDVEPEFLFSGVDYADFETSEG